MTGPAYIAKSYVEGSAAPLLTPTCDAHERRWEGAHSFSPDAASTNVAVHNTDDHKPAETGAVELDLEPHSSGKES